MPWVICPVCHTWSLRQSWLSADGQRIPFRIVCPCCTVDSDIAGVPMRLRPPDGVVHEQRMAALALRVSRAITAIQ